MKEEKNVEADVKENKTEEKKEVKHKTKESKKIQISLGMAIFLFALMLLLIVGVIIGAVLINRNNKKEYLKNENIIVNEVITENYTEPEISDDVLVYTAFEESGNWYKYSIPKLNIDSDDATVINYEIEEKLIKEVKEQINSGKGIENYGYNPSSIEYDYYINGNILSVVITLGTDVEYSSYYVYNINIETGKKCTNEEILEYKGISAEEFEKKLSSIYGERFSESYSGFKGSELYDECYEKTISKENCNINNPIFIEDNGQINVIAKIYSLVGALHYYHIILIPEEESTTTTTDAITELSKENTFFGIENIEKIGNEYEITAYIIDPLNKRIFTEEEYNKIKNGEKFTFRNAEWQFVVRNVGEQESEIDYVESGDKKLSIMYNEEEKGYILENVAGICSNGLEDYSDKMIIFRVNKDILIGDFWTIFSYNVNGDIQAEQESFGIDFLIEHYDKDKGTYGECEAFISNGKVDAIKINVK